ncbi:MAG: phosphoesterase [Desulfococcus sp. 4484_241]|nr:MAG: phosphoesterase [Desulfococcus sp. 4484_241]
MTISNIERLNLFYNRFKSRDNVLVLVNADPDAIASAMAVKRLLWKKVASVTLSNINVIERPDNRAMVRLLGVRMVHTDKVQAGDYDRFVIVDSQPGHNERFASFPADVVIDHHPVEPHDDSGYFDIRPDYGAASTIMTEYLKAARIKPSIKLATALYLGIKTDTANFERNVLIEDVRAFRYVFQFANIYLARKIEHADIKPEFLKYFSRAFDRIVFRKKRIFVHLGRVENTDICVILADFFMRVSTVQWSVVSGEHEGLLVVILRNDGARRDAGKTAKKFFGAMGSAGGHKSAARAEIPLKELYKRLSGRTDHEIQRWIMDKLG